LQIVPRSSLHLGGIVALGCLGATIAGARAQEYCVACTEPRAVYRCVIEGARPGGRQPLQMLCLAAMTKEGRHAACSVSAGTVFECDGPVKRVPWAAYNVGTKAEAPDPAAAAANDPEEPPRTVAEMLARANAKTAEQLRQANENVKSQAQALGRGIDDAGKKTWKCLSSLFTRCGGE
jgi:hypothetical protein